MKNYVKHPLSWVTICGMFLILTACKKNNDRVPTVAVNEYINLNLPEFLPLNAINNWIYYNYAENKGIIITRTGPTEFTALERTCTYDPSVSSAYVKGIPNDIFCVDSTCGSKFNLIDGSVVTGPASIALLRYRTELLSNNFLHIFN